VWGKGWLDVQVRSNGFIAAAPSLHPNGRQYRWLDDRMPAQPGTLLLANRPEREPLVRPGSKGGGKRADGLDGDLAEYAENGIPVGWQDTEFYRLACKNVRAMAHQELYGWLWAAACKSVQKPEDPWKPEDIWAKIQRAAEFISLADAEILEAHRRMLEALR
jgi:hypothetical protein